MKAEVAAVLALASLGMGAFVAQPGAVERTPSAQQAAEVSRSIKSLPATGYPTPIGEQWLARALGRGSAFVWRNQLRNRRNQR
jgi:hypothetical protein